jgi:hypothetical protein
MYVSVKKIHKLFFNSGDLFFGAKMYYNGYFGYIENIKRWSTRVDVYITKKVKGAVPLIASNEDEMKFKTRELMAHIFKG